MTLQYYRPLGLLGQIQRDMNQLLDKHYSEDEAVDNSKVVTSHWSPAVDIREDENQYVLLADLPGVEAKDIDVTMDDGVLTLKGQRDEVKEEERDGYHRVERTRGNFYRRFSLPDIADASRINAVGKNGVLEITIPKLEKALPQKIEVKS